MSKLSFIGVDPGISGAVAIYHPDTRNIDVLDIPIIETKAAGRKTVRREINEPVLSKWIACHYGRSAVAYVEQVGAMPRQGVSSMFRFGMAYGMVRGMLTAHGIPYALVTPRKWKGKMGLGSHKDEARLIASRMFPDQSFLFDRKKDAHRAEAVLIAVYGSKHGEL